MDSPQNEYNLASAVSKACTSAHQQLRQILAALPNKDDTSRKQFLLKYALHTRHTFARLLALVRWHKKHGCVAVRATQAEDTALANTQSFEDVVDSLWDIRARVSSKFAPRPAVASAVGLLTSKTLTSPPPQTNSPPKLHNPRPSKRPRLTPDSSEVTLQFTPSNVTPTCRLPKSSSLSRGPLSPSVPDRLAITTRNCIRESQLHIGDVRVISWRSGLEHVCVKIGVPDLWSADVSFDSLNPHLALLRVHSIHVFVASDIDAPTYPQNHWSARSYTSDPARSSLTTQQQALLRRMADDRMSFVLKAVRSVTTSNTNVNSCSIMICALRDLMMDEVCAPMAMDCLRSQARALSAGVWSKHIKVDGGEPENRRNTALTISYWPDYRQPAFIRIHEHHLSSSATPTAEPGNSVQLPPQPLYQSDSRCLSCIHQPALPNALELGKPHSSYVMQLSRLHLEEQLNACIKLRSCARINSISQAFVDRSINLRIDPSCLILSEVRKPGAHETSTATTSAYDVISIRFGGSSPTGLEVKIFNMTGGIRIRPYGAASLAVPVQRKADSAVWLGARHFGSKLEEVESVLRAFEVVRAEVKLHAAARSVCALDVGVSNTLPPGTASVAAMASPERQTSQLVPPFAPLERRAPRRFLTLSPPPTAKDSLFSVPGSSSPSSRHRSASVRGFERAGSSKRPRLTYATTSDSLVFIQESSFAGGDWRVGHRDGDGCRTTSRSVHMTETDSIDRYSGTAAAAAAWAVTREVVERRLKRDSLIRAFYRASVFAQTHHMRTSEDSDLHLESASRVLLKVKCEPLPVRRAELRLRGYDVWQVRLSLLPSIFDSTDSEVPSEGGTASKSGPRSRGTGNLWSVGVSCTGSQLTFTYPSANPDSVRSFFRDLTRARTAAALARGVPPSRFYRVLQRSPIRLVVGIGPFGRNLGKATDNSPPPKPQYTATVEYVYSKQNSGGFSLSFSPSRDTMEQLAPLIEEALDASGGQVGGILAGLLERACPVAAAAESALKGRGYWRVSFLTALRVRAVFSGNMEVNSKDGKHVTTNAQGHRVPQTAKQYVKHAVDVDARGGCGLVTVTDVGRAITVMAQQGLFLRNQSGARGQSGGIDHVSLPKWDEIVSSVIKDGYAEPQRSDSTVVLKMEMLETFLSRLVSSGAPREAS